MIKIKWLEKFSRKNYFYLLMVVLMIGLVDVIKLQTGLINLPKSETQTAEVVFKSCQKNSDKSGCYQSQFSQIIRTNSFLAVVQTLFKLQKLDNSLMACHSMAHYIATAEVKKNPTDWLKVLAQADPAWCGRGFFHGVIEEHMRSDPNFYLSPTTIFETCQKINDLSVRKLSSFELGLRCYHVLGHLILLQERGSVARAIKICSEIEADFQNDCYNGVFMENIEKRNLIQANLAEKRLVPDELTIKSEELNCQNLRGDQSLACWNILSQLYVQAAGLDYQQLHEFCLHAPSEEAQIRCYINGLTSIIIAKLSEKGKSDQLLAIDYCSYFATNQKFIARCIKKIVDDVFDTSAAFESVLSSFCQQFDLENRNYCLVELSQKEARVN